MEHKEAVIPSFLRNVSFSAKKLRDFITPTFLKFTHGKEIAFKFSNRAAYVTLLKKFSSYSRKCNIANVVSKLSLNPGIALIAES